MTASEKFGRIAAQERERKMKDMNTRTMQDLLRNTQIKLETCTLPEVRDSYKLLISYLATELLFRYRLGK